MRGISVFIGFVEKPVHNILQIFQVNYQKGNFEDCFKSLWIELYFGFIFHPVFMNLRQIHRRKK